MLWNRKSGIQKINVQVECLSLFYLSSFNHPEGIQWSFRTGGLSLEHVLCGFCLLSFLYHFGGQKLFAHVVPNCACFGSELNEELNRLYVVLEFGETDLSGFFSTRSKYKQGLDSTLIKFYWGEMLRAVNALHKEG